MNLPKSRSPAEREKFRQAALKKQMRGDTDPTAEQIAERCAEIRAERKPEKLEPVVKPVEIMVTRFSFED